jgi:cytochrome bd-type quinol oxidase subunit 1
MIIKSIMTEEKKQPTQQEQKQPPALGAYSLTVFMGLLGLWCMYDGWFTTNPEMFRHMDFNRIMSVVFIAVAIFDFRYVSRKKKQAAAKSDKTVAKDDSKS